VLKHPAKRRIGPAARWPRQWAFRCAPYTGSGKRIICSLAGSGHSRNLTTPLSPKVEDIVGVYMNPPSHAVVMSIDEKS